MTYVKLPERFISPRCDEVAQNTTTAKMKNYSLGVVNAGWKASEANIASSTFEKANIFALPDYNSIGFLYKIMFSLSSTVYPLKIFQ